MPETATATDPVTALIDKNMGLAYKQIFNIVRISQTHADYDDVVQVARIALWNAINKYNPAKMSRFTGDNVRLTTYAVIAIQRALRRWMQLRNRHGFSKVGDGNRKQYWESFVPVKAPVRLDQPENEAYGDMVEVVAKEPRQEAILTKEIAETVSSALGRLWQTHPKIAGVVYQRFIQHKTLQAIADDFSLSKERIRQLLRKGIVYLRDGMSDEWEEAA